MYYELMEAYIKRWKFVRSETLNLLKIPSDDQLAYKPQGDTWQTIYHQFGCIARTQIVYTAAVANDKMDFSVFESSALPSKDAHQTVKELLNHLNACEEDWLSNLTQNTNGVVWPDELKPLGLHIMALAEHERMHHGQLISYFTLAGLELPESFKKNWAL